MKKLFALTSIFLAPALAFGQQAAMVVSETVNQALPAMDPNTAFLTMLLQSMGGLNGAGALAVAGVVVKLLLRAMDLPMVAAILGKQFKERSGAAKLTIVLGLSYISGVLALMAPPTSLALGAALVHSSTMAAFLVLSNQVYKHWLEPAAKTEPQK